MDITITAASEVNTNGFREAAANQVRRTLARFSNRIARVAISVTDENGLRGGIDKQCRVSVLIPGIGEFATTGKDECPWMAVDQAARRARRKLLTKLKRPRSQRERFRRDRWSKSDTSDL